MSSAGEHKMGNFSFDFLCKNNFILFPQEMNHWKIISVMKYWVGTMFLRFELSMSRAGERKNGDFPFDLFKNI